ncbi:MAG: ISSpo3, transposase [Candidatus Jorgensenbacteria bacterium GW2011_GWA1_48_11]|uniref:ISSpo3, transposase n=1 Tax=Candidatus Jorgensenbacteria bacterium GW2011_GWA1_48_11 TaxID=1618660 RepID=A0A0G1XBC4_9BACT|nr:MAG: ISSpo3, transposase [Candidatus Jorgensenbacteria bacterium GW2011_GWA1_48_11]KKW12083.1 MAG: ISSpo3, transposase [Candidatus Jorgensenbacteria bacterium GW2011_GWB1_49_9]
MNKVKKYSIRDLKRDFPTDEACAAFIFDALHSRKCSCGGTYSPLKGRRQFQCSKCRYQIAPTAGTIFHKSDTPLSLWFYTLFLFSNAKSGISAKELERQLGVTYKTAWRILNLIRKALPQNTEFLTGDVEIDETHFGGKGDAGKDNKKLKAVMRNKSIIAGAVERGGRVRAKIVPNLEAKTIGKFIDNNVNPITTRLFTDKSRRYESVARGYDRFSVNHSQKEFAVGDIYINTMEAFWSHLKRSIKGTHKVVSKKYLQSYVDGFVWHYNNRHSDSERFSALLGALLPASK